METEDHIKTRLGRHYISIWNGCAPSVADAIKEFRERWAPYSVSSRRYSIFDLLGNLIDPAINEYIESLPPKYKNYLNFSTRLIREVGFDVMLLSQRHCLRQFLAIESTLTHNDTQFIATVESLIELIFCCRAKRPKRSKPPGDKQRLLNTQRPQGFCRFCGSLTELASLIKHGNWPQGDQEKLRLSHRYCAEHRPVFSDGTQNPAYRRAMRSIDHFDTELLRLGRQNANLKRLQAQSGNQAVDCYIHSQVTQKFLEIPADLDELRNQARWIADNRLTDRKKIILTMTALGHNQSQVAKALGISRQAISKALATIPDAFRLDETH
ncbi:helix-turn-helix domain-containing protein [Amphibiibacter pelophylacis]|uniref:Helix-turn-helix domain-containing protein n=1 Tax=Amphibiibacter pelophylacis TaxID=1799477 RepID=A0ACC6P684_9BURK